MDLRLGADLFDSFKKYQTLLIEEFDKMAEEFRWVVVDARKPPDEIQQTLRARISPILTGEPSVSKTDEHTIDETPASGHSAQPVSSSSGS